MPSETLLNFDSLTAPIAGDSPAGAPLPYDVRLKLEELRKEINPDDYDADDPRRPAEARKPDWSGIVQLACDTLAHTSKDLLVAARLTEAITIDRGMTGLRDAVELLLRLVEQCWDRVHPLIAEGESPEVREGPFKWLNQADYGSRFPRTVRAVPLIRVDGNTFNASDWQNQSTRGRMESAVSSMSTEECQNLVDDLKAIKEKLHALDKNLRERMGDHAPDLVSSEGSDHVGAAVRDCLMVATKMLQMKQGVPVSNDDPVGGGGGGAGVARSMSSRADAYRMLNDAADLLQQLEPHSPIPYLVKRAVKLGELKFPELMRALIRENTVIDELQRLMGLEPPASG